MSDTETAQGPERPDPHVPDLGAAYHELRNRVVALLRDAGPAVATTRTPACPEWTVKDVAAHLCGVCLDIVAGNLDGVTTDAWTAAHVARFADADLAAVLDEWERVGVEIDPIVPFFPGMAGPQFVFDATLHEHDIRGALGLAGGRSSSSVIASLFFVSGVLDQAVRANGWPPLELRAEGYAWSAGDGAPERFVDGDLFDLVRSFGGRRSVDQIVALDWTGDPTPYLSVFDTSPVRPRDTPLVE